MVRNLHQRAISVAQVTWRFFASAGNVRAIGVFLVGIPALWGAWIFIAERVFPDPELEKIVAAKDFWKAEGVNTTAPEKCWEGLLLNEPPYRPQNNAVEYRVFLKRSGNYSLLFEYAAAESRGVKVEVNGKVLAEKALETKTESWCNDRTRWENVGVVRMRAGANLIRVTRPDVFPHLKTLKLLREDV